ncbi:MAG TPA: alcohol dehydrogenase catalytic domain-containing protein [Chloroflexota bacterium]
MGDHDVQVEDAPPPTPGPGEVLVEPRFVGICGSDVHIYEGLHPGVARPIVLGHECTGIVVGSSNGSLAPGTPVGVVPLFGCGECAHCRLGQSYICIRREVMGFQRPGCLSELLALPAANVLPIRDGQDLALLSLFEPLAVAMHGANLAEPARGEHAIIVGAGNIGLLLATYLRFEVGVTVSLIDIHAARVRLARELGFEAVGQLSELDLGHELARPLAFDCVGLAASADTILDIVPAPRVAVLIGTYQPNASVGLARLKRWETRVVGSQIYTLAELQRAIDILGSPTRDAYRRLQVQDQYELAQIRDALEAARASSAGTKVVVRIDSQSPAVGKR